MGAFGVISQVAPDGGTGAALVALIGLAVAGMMGGRRRSQRRVAMHAEGLPRTTFAQTRLAVERALLDLRYTGELLATGQGGIGYLLKERVGDVPAFLDSLRRVAAGGTALDREVVAELMQTRGRDDDGPLAALSPREHEVLGLMAEGRTNAAVARALVVTPGAVEKHVTNIFSKLDLPATDDDHRRVLAVLTFLRASGG